MENISCFPRLCGERYWLQRSTKMLFGVMEIIYILIEIIIFIYVKLISSFQSLSCVWLFESQWTAACQASLSITNFQSFFKLMSIESVMPSNHLSFCHPLLLLPSIFPSIRVFSNESVLRLRWPCFGALASASIRSMNIPFNDFPYDWLVWSCSPRDS